jgi:hypothetical protein
VKLPGAAFALLQWAARSVEDLTAFGDVVSPRWGISTLESFCSVVFRLLGGDWAVLAPVWSAALVASPGGGAVAFPAETGVFGHVNVLRGLFVAGCGGQHEGIVDLCAHGVEFGSKGDGTHGEKL